MRHSVSSYTAIEHMTADLFFMSVFILILPRSMRRALFPYTTLFRSSKKVSDILIDQKRKRLAKAHAWVLEDQEGIDRKSTRLNSSHLVSSYAVFCLKKKKNIQQ